MPEFQLIYSPTFESLRLAEHFAGHRAREIANLEKIKKIAAWPAGLFSGLTLMFLYELIKAVSGPTESKLGGFLIFLFATTGTYLIAHKLMKLKYTKAIEQILSDSKVKLEVTNTDVCFSSGNTITTLSKNELRSFHVEAKCLCIHFDSCTAVVPMLAFTSDAERQALVASLQKSRNLAEGKAP